MQLKNKIGVIAAVIGCMLLLQFIGYVVIMRSVMIVTARYIISSIIFISFMAYMIIKKDSRFRWYFLAMVFSSSVMDEVEILFPTLQVTLCIIPIPVFIIIEIFLISYCGYLLYERKQLKKIDTL